MNKPEKVRRQPVKQAVYTEKGDDSVLQISELLFDNAADSILLFDNEGNIHYANETWFNSLGYTRAELPTLNLFRDVVAPSFRRENKLGDLDKISQVSFESADVRKDGSIIPVEIHVRPIELYGNKLLLGVVRDITERKKAEEELRLKELILDKASDSILLRDLDGKIVYANEVAYRSRGYTKEEFSGMDVRQLLPPVQAKAVVEREKEVLQKGSITFESALVRKDGSQVPTELNMNVIEVGDKKYILSIVRDISERKKAEEDLQLKEHIIDRAADTIILRDLNGKLIYANEIAYTSRGYTLEEFANLSPYKMGTDKANRLIKPMKDEVLKKGLVFYETTHIRKDGSLLPVEVELRTIDYGGRTLILSVIHDITERRKAEEELRFKEQVLDKSTDSIIIRDADAKIVYANETAYKSRGYTREEFLNMTVFDLLAPGQRGKAAPQDMQKPGSTTFESIHKRKDGSLMPVEINRNIVEFGGKTFSVTISRDITERKKAEEELRLKEQILDKASDSIILREPDGKIVYANEEAYKSRDCTKEQFIGANMRQFMIPSETERFEARSQEILQKGTVSFESVHVRRDGSTVPVETSGNVIESGGKKYLLGVVRDITPRKKMEEELRLKERILDNATDAIIMRKLDGTIIYANEMVCGIFGHTREELIGMNLRQLLVPEEAELVDARAKVMLEKGTVSFESVNVRKDGSLMPVEVRASAIESGSEKFIVSIVRDITERKKMEEYIKQLAYYDILTGLPNRTLFNDHFAQALAHAARYQHKLALLVMDIDHFKDVNDSLGHAAGDKLLKEIANRLSGIMRKIDTVSRMGGDEFLLLLPEITGKENTAFVAQKILEAIRQPITLMDKELQVTASIGIALYPDDGNSLDILLRNADDAMYRAKREGRNSYHHYIPEMD